MRLSSFGTGDRKESRSLLAKSAHVESLAPENNIGARWVEDAEHVGIGYALDCARRQHGHVEVVVVFGCVPPVVQAFVVMLEVVAHHDVAEGRRVVHLEADPQRLTLRAEPASLAPQCLRDVRGCVENVLNRDPRMRHVAGQLCAVEIVYGDKQCLALQLDCP